MGVTLSFEEKRNIFLKKLKERYQDVYPEFNFVIKENTDFISNDDFVFISFTLNDEEYEWKTKPRYMNGKRLPKEISNYLKKINNRYNTKKLTQEEFESKFYSRFNKSEYKVLGDYINMHTKIDILHEKCKKTIPMIPNNLLNHSNKNTGCSYCNSKRNKSLEEYQELFNNNNLTDYKINECFTKSGHMYAKITHENDECENYNFQIRISDILSSHNHRCPKCRELKKESRAVKDIKEYLKENNISYENEVALEGLVFINPLKLDFFIPEKNLFIEYDGIQHFKNTFNMDKEKYEKVKLRDEIKNQFFKENDKYNLERISYMDNHIDKLKTILEKY